MRTLLHLFLAALFALMAPAVIAEETINRYDVRLEVQKNGDLTVIEAITVNAEGNVINRGIFRDLPRLYERDGVNLPYQYDVKRVTRDGRQEPYTIESEGNAYRIRIGDAEVYLQPGAHAYEIEYLVRNQVRYFDGYDELYWNVTGNFWAFPILEARATVAFPPGARVTQQAAYTGALGATGSDVRSSTSGDIHVFETTRRMEAGEGLTVAVGIAKGVIDPPSGADRGWLWWQRNGALVILLGSFAGIFYFLYRTYTRVGRDPPRTPVFPIYEAPEGLSPAAVHHIYYRGVRGHTALIATLMNLAVKGQLSIDASSKKHTVLRQSETPRMDVSIAPEDKSFEASVFSGGASKVIGGEYDPIFTGAYTAFQRQVATKYGKPYFKWNTIYVILGLVLTVLGVVFAATQAAVWTGFDTLLVLALAGINLIFMYLMPAPTPKGQKLRSEIAGFRLYMDTAEKLQLNATKVGSDAPPMMTQARYEAFLPYAVALGVEKPWTRHFERMLPAEAAAYHPMWAMHGGSRSLHGLNDAIVSSLSSGVSSALPQSSSSSGSGGGGSSGGGGGGGGGGGW